MGFESPPDCGLGLLRIERTHRPGGEFLVGFADHLARQALACVRWFRGRADRKNGGQGKTLDRKDRGQETSHRNVVAVSFFCP